MSDSAESAAEENTPEGAVAADDEGGFEVEAHAETPLSLQEMDPTTSLISSPIASISATSVVVCC
ncbi:hypothetical protein [Streptomyces sp. CBMA29]|uniref:hypothetical protein n=1 Tax=Streptomyces sp. CBMA29 TaxID=1896314 RepID=UPI0016620512|nr:hypothetical protein [Streptomyces sp. CBMA29]MBD0738412.1 hypothetical protein [Streptomyces sp. CBMA29]